jgi:hypothetical protein
MQVTMPAFAAERVKMLVILLVANLPERSHFQYMSIGGFARPIFPLLSPEDQGGTLLTHLNISRFTKFKVGRKEAPT